jgi:uncharacterized membrane protein
MLVPQSMRLTPGLTLFAIFFIVAGVLHFLFSAPCMRIIPPFLPWHLELLWISGAAEICGGLGLLLPQTRRAAGYGLALLLIAVFPANVYMAIAHLPFPGLMGERWVQWLRLPLQIPLIWWALRYTRANAQQ